MAGRTQQVFTTDELTALLGLDPQKDKRRVINFAESREYGIVPSIKVASGSGSRRLYDLENVCEFALALRLLETGLRSQVIGDVIRQLHKKGKLSAKLTMSGFDLQDLKLVIVREPEPGSPLNKARDQLVSFQKSSEELTEFISKHFCHPSTRCDVILIPIGQTFYELKGQLYQHRQKWALENL